MIKLLGGDGSGNSGFWGYCFKKFDAGGRKSGQLPEKQMSVLFCFVLFLLQNLNTFVSLEVKTSGQKNNDNLRKRTQLKE